MLDVDRIIEEAQTEKAYIPFELACVVYLAYCVERARRYDPHDWRQQIDPNVLMTLMRAADIGTQPYICHRKTEGGEFIPGGLYDIKVDVEGNDIYIWALCEGELRQLIGCYNEKRHPWAEESLRLTGG